MAVEAKTIIYEAQRAMNDKSGVRAPASDLVRLLNRAQRDIAVSRPDTTARVFEHELAEGARQELPEEVALLIDLPANVSGRRRAITRTGLPLLDAAVPDWRYGARKGEIVHFMHDHRTPRAFWVYPPAIDGTSVEMEASMYPADILVPAGDSSDDVAGVISLADEWSTALLLVVLYYAYMTDLEGAGNPLIAASYKETAEKILGVQLQSAMVFAKQEQ